VGEERRLVTVLFADIVGSTSLNDDHDPELVRATLQSAFATCRDIVAEHGGTVEKFIGDEVMAVFGVPEAHEDDAERAVRAAFAIRRAMAERNSRSRLPLQMRYGINSGEVVSGSASGDVMVTGRAVNAGARVREAAAPEEILVGANTRELALTAVRFGASRSIMAKGIGTMQVWPAEKLVSEMPIRALARQAPIVGREDELQLVRALERRMHDSQRPFLVTIFGPAGIGKSRFAAEFIDGIGVERSRVGHCLPYGQASAFWPLREILHADARIGADDTREEALGKLRTRIRSVFADGSEDPGAMSRRLGVLAGLMSVDEALPDVQSANLASELRLALRRYLERRTRGKPLVLVFEDLHWADPALLDTIDHLAEWAAAPLLLVCLARPELLDTRPSWGAGRTNATALTLPPLSYGDAHALVDGLLPKHALPAAVRDEIVRRAEGNPLYVEEFVRMLRELEETGPTAGGSVDLAEFVRIALPATLQGLVSSRLDRLAPAVRDALRRAAVFGERFSSGALTELDAAPLDVDAALSFATQRDLVVPISEPVLGGGQGFRFRHALIREVSYREMSKSDRWRMHDAAGRWIETASGDRAPEHEDLVAYHAEQAFWNARELEAHETDALGLRAFERIITAATNWRRASRWVAASSSTRSRSTPFTRP